MLETDSHFPQGRGKIPVFSMDQANGDIRQFIRKLRYRKKAAFLNGSQSRFRKKRYAQPGNDAGQDRAQGVHFHDAIRNNAVFRLNILQTSTIGTALLKNHERLAQ